MARRFPFEWALGGALVLIAGFVAAQVLTAPAARGRAGAAPRTLPASDSTRLTALYRARVAALGAAYVAPEWLAEVQLAHLRRAALHAPAADSVPTLDDALRAVLAEGEGARGSYLRAMVAEDSGVVARWPARHEPIAVWIQPHSTEAGFTSELIGPARMAFLVWNELALGAAFAFVDDSTQAEVHVTWRAALPESGRIGTTFRMTDARGWIVLAHVVLSTAYDIHAVQNAARHEVGHVLGLGHSPDRRDIMAAATEGRQYLLTDADRRTAALVYRLPAGRLGSGVAW